MFVLKTGIAGKKTKNNKAGAIVFVTMLVIPTSPSNTPIFEPNHWNMDNYRLNAPKCINPNGDITAILAATTADLLCLNTLYSSNLSQIHSTLHSAHPPTVLSFIFNAVYSAPLQHVIQTPQ